MLFTERCRFGGAIILISQLILKVLVKAMMKAREEQDILDAKIRHSRYPSKE